MASVIFHQKAWALCRDRQAETEDDQCKVCRIFNACSLVPGSSSALNQALAKYQYRKLKVLGRWLRKNLLATVRTCTSTLCTPCFRIEEKQASAGSVGDVLCSAFEMMPCLSNLRYRNLLSAEIAHPEGLLVPWDRPGRDSCS